MPEVVYEEGEAMSQSLIFRSNPPEATQDWCRECARHRTKSWCVPMTTEEVEESGEWGDQARMVRSEEAEMTGARKTSSVFQALTCVHLGQ